MTARDRLGWFHLNPGDLIADPAVQAMTDEQLGKYLRVLCAMYLRNSGTAGEEEVRAWARCSEAEWPGHREALVRAFSVRRNGEWLQKRVEVEVKAAKNRVKKARKKALAGARGRWPSMRVHSLKDA